MQIMIDILTVLVAFILGSEIEKMHIIKIFEKVTVQVNDELERILEAEEEEQ